MAPTAHFCGFPQGLNQEDLNSILESCKGNSTLPPKQLAPFKTQNFQLITGLLSSTLNLVQTYQKLVGYKVMFFVTVDAAIRQQYFSPRHPSKVSALSKSDTKLYFLLHVKQPKKNLGKHSTMEENGIEKTSCHRNGAWRAL